MGRSHPPIIQQIKPFEPCPGGQEQFWDLLSAPPDGVRWIYGRGGCGSGKSTVAIAWFCNRRLLEPSAPSLLTANSYPQLSRSTLVVLARHCRLFGIPLSPLEDNDELTARAIANRQFCTIGSAHVFVVSMENFSDKNESGRGMECVDILADELATANKDGFDVLETRLGRGYVGKLGRGIGVGVSSPNKRNPYNWAWELFDSPSRSEDVRKRYASTVLSAEDNLYLPDSYCEDLKARYIPELYTLEVLGEYCAVASGKAVRSFNRANNCLTRADGFIYDPTQSVWWSADFNVNPVTSIIGQVFGNDLVILAEFCLTDSDTYELAETVCRWLTSRNHSARIYLTGDATGNSKHASSKKTNWQIILDTLSNARLKHLTSRRYGDSNPGVLDSTLILSNAFKQQRVWLVEDDCPELLLDLESMRWKENSSSGSPQLDKSDPRRSHLFDCLRYCVWSLRNDLAKSKVNDTRSMLDPKYRVPGLS